MSIDDFYTLMVNYLITFVVTWKENSEVDSWRYPLEYDNTSEWIDQFFTFVENEQLENENEQF